ncbi:hypothetical protein FA95DRAFT_1608546 [Auriscalpium vulgare]|uniref:Uncharacterized protein n=1 Tax=Auriscalpium vulgare TaxID=40419 RepID=A0ACB8RKL3_9AGAM|nr:hypothetical protein FA95DRAFT_1608546 [Auriscalpium vulgare]
MALNLSAQQANDHETPAPALSLSPAAATPRPLRRAQTAPVKYKQPAKGTTRGKRGRLSALPSLPLDILYEIFGNLPPGGLLQLARTTKAFRQMLLARRSLFLWKCSFSRVPDAPPRPDDMSIPAWANLLFGGTSCFTCGAKFAANTLFILRRRACKSCVSEHLLSDAEASARFGVAIIDLQGLPSVYQAVGSRIEDRWWDEDVAHLAKELDALRAQHESVLSEAFSMHLSEFRAAKKAAKAVKLKHSNLCQQWKDREAQNRRDHLAEEKAKRFMKTRLLALNYESEDIEAIWGHRETSVAKPMTDRVWARVYPILQVELARKKEERLQSGRLKRRADRAASLSETWKAHVSTFPVRIAPIALGIKPLSLSILDASIEADEPESAELTARMNAACVAATPQAIEFIRVAAEGLLALLPRTGPAPSLSTEAILSDGFFTGKAGGLCLATSQFRCGNECLHQPVGSTGIEMLAHFCSRPQFSEARRTVVSHLLGLLQMDPDSTTASELDRAEAQIICMDCPPGSGHFGPVGRKSMNWRSCVYHSTYQHGGQSRADQWRLLNDDEARRARENYVPTGSDRGWGCGHCNYHIGPFPRSTWCFKADVLIHVETQHAIKEPILEVDYVQNPLTGVDDEGGYLV